MPGGSDATTANAVTGVSSARTGRRPGQSGTREAILEAARARFADVGFDKASVRSIAALAAVDPALVHHYFGTKRDLFLAAVDLPVDPRVVMDVVAAAPLEHLGEYILRAVVGVWDSPSGEAMVATFRTLLSGETDPTLMRTFLVEVVLESVQGRVDVPAGSGRKRIALVESQIMGLGVARKILCIEPIASMPIDELVAAAAPTLQRYLTGELP